MADAGIGEAMLLSAAMGGGSAAITGGDPLKGAMLGAATGAIGFGLMPGAPVPGAVPSATPGIVSGVGDAAAQTAAQTVAQVGPGINTLPATGYGDLYASAAPTTGQAMSAIDANGFNPANLPAPSPTGPSLFNDPMAYLKNHQFMAGSSALAGATGARYMPHFPGEDPNNPLKKFRYDPSTYVPSRPYAGGGITSLGGNNMVVGNDNPAAQGESNPSSWEAGSFPVSYMASGGISDLGSYSDGGRMLEGPGDGMSDSIPASIAGKRPARLAQGEFVVPADVVSHLGNGSTDAGANQLYHMMDKVRQARTGRKSQGREINPGKYMPA